MLDQFKLYGSICLLVVLLALGATVKVLWDKNADLKAQVVEKEAELAAQERATRAVEQVAQAASERAAAMQPIRTEVNRAPAGGCVGPAVRTALDGLRKLQGPREDPGQP